MSSLTFSRVGRILILNPLLNTYTQTLGFQNLPLIEDNEHKYQQIDIRQIFANWQGQVLNAAQRKQDSLTFERYIDRPELLNHILPKVIIGTIQAGGAPFSATVDCNIIINRVTTAGITETLINRTLTASARNLSGNPTEDPYFFNFDQVSLQRVVQEFDRLIVTITIGITNNSGVGQTIQSVFLYAQKANADKTTITLHLEPYRNLEGRVV